MFCRRTALAVRAKEKNKINSISENDHS